MRYWCFLIVVAILTAEPVSSGVVQAHHHSSIAKASAILRHLDLDSFPNSTGPRRQRSLHTPMDYGFTELDQFSDGWVQTSEPENSWHMSAFLLDDGVRSATICFGDAAGRDGTYRAVQVLHVTLGATGLWTAVQVPDRVGCHNNPPLAISSPPL